MRCRSQGVDARLTMDLVRVRVVVQEEDVVAG